MDTKEKLKNVIPLLLFKILLPTADIVTDLHLIIKLYHEGVKYELVQLPGNKVRTSSYLPSEYILGNN